MQDDWLITILAFSAALIATQCVYWLFFYGRGARKAINRRLALSEKSGSRLDVFAQLEREGGFADLNTEKFSGLKNFLMQTGLKLNTTKLVIWTLACGALVFGGMGLLVSDELLSIGAGIVGGPLIVLGYLKFVRSRRISRFGFQLPDAVNVIVRGLRVGHPFSVAVELVAREMADPIGTEFGITADEITFGQDVTVAVNNLFRRVGHEDLLFVVIAVSVQAQTGGNLAEVLARLSKLVREREKLRLKVRALSSEGRLSAYFLTAIPFVLCGAVKFMSPDYFTDFIQSTALAPTLIYVGASLVISNFVIYRLVNFQV